MDSLRDPLWQILRDPLWQFIGFIGTIIVWFATQRSRTNKSIIFTILAQKLLMYKASIFWATDLPNAWQEILQKTSDEAEKRLINNFFKQIEKDLFETIDRIYLVDLKVCNAGNVSIRYADYEVPIEFEFGPELLYAEVVKTAPADLKKAVTLYRHANSVSFKPFLLNSGDWIRLGVLLRHLNNHITATGRIDGVKEITEQKRFAAFIKSLIGMDSTTYFSAFVGVCMFLFIGLALQFLLHNSFSQAILLFIFAPTSPVLVYLLFIPLTSAAKRLLLLLASATRKLLLFLAPVVKKWLLSLLSATKKSLLLRLSTTRGSLLFLLLFDVFVIKSSWQSSRAAIKNFLSFLRSMIIKFRNFMKKPFTRRTVVDP